MDKTFILTAEMDDESFAWLDGLRRLHFPPGRNFLPAHLTLFHRLTSSQVSGLQSLQLPVGPVDLHFDRFMFLGLGVAVHVQSNNLERLRNAARNVAVGEFTRQDSQAWKPHVTIQNKVSAESAKALQRTLEVNFAGRVGRATGLLVWEYLGGPWKPVDRLPFKPTSE